MNKATAIHVRETVVTPNNYGRESRQQQCLRIRTSKFGLATNTGAYEGNQGMNGRDSSMNE